MRALFVAESKNAKIAGSHGVSATYASIEGTCPRSCRLYAERTCYAMAGYVRYVLNRFKSGGTSVGIANEEAGAIREAFGGGPVPQDGARGGRDLRLHVSGDCRTVTGARVLASAARDWLLRGGGAVWTYTHAARTVPRAAWGDVQVLGSIDSLADLPAVRKQGYAPARYVAEFPSEKAWHEAGTRWIPCPAQSRDLACTDCRLCLNVDALRKRGAGIAFAAHGARRNTLKRRLPVLRPDGAAAP